MNIAEIINVCIVAADSIEENEPKTGRERIVALRDAINELLENIEDDHRCKDKKCDCNVGNQFFRIIGLAFLMIVCDVDFCKQAKARHAFTTKVSHN